MKLAGLVTLEEKVYRAGELWGSIVRAGDPLPCGCEWRGGDRAGALPICGDKCHDLYRMVHRLG